MADRSFLLVPVGVAAAIAVDFYVNDSLATLFLIKKLMHLVEYMEFWR